MIKDDLFVDAINIEQELTNVANNIENNNITSLELCYLKWKLNNIANQLSKIETQINEFKTNKIKLSYKFIILAIFFLISIFYSYFLELNYLFILNTILFTGISICYLIYFTHKEEDLPHMTILDFIKELNKQKEKLTKMLLQTKVSSSKIEKRLNDNLIKEMFDQADLDINEMIESTNINLNYKDRDYRKFIINLYDLKINEKDLNVFYREILKTILEKDLANDTRYL